MPKKAKSRKAKVTAVQNKEARKKICKLFENEQRDSLDWWLQVGKQLDIVYPSGSEQKNHVMRAIAQDVLSGHQDCNKTKNTVNLLYIARNLHSWGRKKLKPLITSLSITHLITLARADKTLRDQLAQKCINKKWSVRMLRQEVHKKQGKRASSGGRTAKLLEDPTPSLAFREIRKLARRWKQCHDDFTKRKLFKNAKKEDVDKVEAQELLEQLKEMAVMVEKQQQIVKRYCCG